MTTPTSVPHLFALAHGRDCAGPYRCFYCAAPCGEEYPTAEYVRDSFTGRNGVPCPGSPWVCAGCVLCLREGVELTTLDGVTRQNQKMRGYSWIITADSAKAATKAHLDQLRHTCLMPPVPPWAVVLSDSGQKHLLYRGVVNHGGEPWAVTLEGERIDYTAWALTERLLLIGRFIAATGKPAALEPIDARMALAVMQRYPQTGEAVLAEWERVREQPLSRMAQWLSPAKEDCLAEYHAETTAEPGLPGVPQEISRVSRPGTAPRRNRKGRSEGVSDSPVQYPGLPLWG